MPTSTNLHNCPECNSGLVYPLEWEPVDLWHWRVELRCPECEWQRTAVHGQTVLDRFDDALDAGTNALLNDLGRLQRANMEEELARFNVALTGDLILPEDF